MTVKAAPENRGLEEQEVWVYDHALTFEQYLTEYEGYKEHIELVRGVPKTRMAANLVHEGLFAWLFRLLGDYVEWHNMGFVFGSRTAVKITNYDGRLPDILFVRKERKEILEWMQLTAAPDLVVELNSPGDRRSDKMELEADYKSIGVPEIVFIDMGRKRIQALRKVDDGYRIDEITQGRVEFEAVPGFWVEASWLLDENRPPVHEALAAVESTRSI